MMLKTLHVHGLSKLWLLFSLWTFPCYGETNIIVCKCSETPGYMEQSKHLSTLQVCIHHTNAEAILMGLHDMVIATHNNTVITTLEDEHSFTVECSQNYCEMGVTVGNDDSLGFIDALDSSSLELSGNVTVQELIDTSTGQGTSHEISLSVSLSSNDDSCPSVTPETITPSIEGAVMVMSALVLIVILCCYGAKFRKTTASDIPL
eukprot:scaffold1064_cov85-Amphora_coffeaeformis.AAC.21